MATKRSALQSVPVQQSLEIEGSNTTPREAIGNRSSKELVIAFSGPIGCGIQAVKERACEILSDLGYAIEPIKVSDYIKSCMSDKVVRNVLSTGMTKAERYKELQDAGNNLREHQTDILAEYAIQQVASIRTKGISETEDDIKAIEPKKVAYVIDQLKHPDEVQLLRMVYGNLFYLFGVLSVSTRRKARLKDDGVNESEISELVERDRRQADKHGQQLDKTLQLADFFIRNDHANAEALSKQIRRFCDLIHGGVGITPTLEEYGMYVAYAAGLRSACLSRQVGASIMSQDGRILATGRNEVPRAGGGLYGPESGDNDARCVVLEGKQCFNDLHKRNLRRDIGEIIERELSKKINTVTEAITSISPEAAEIIKNDLTPGNLAEQLSNEAYAGTRLSSLIEFSRSIHAEMDAIVSLARSGTGATQGASLFTYTFPCHNCARHIVAAGISKVYFLEPYEKSLATDLHWDAIDVEPERPSTTDGVRSGKVQFVHFEGVAPRQYLNMFSINGERKDEQGKAITLSTRQSGKKVPEYLDDYRDYEAKVVQHLESLITELKQQQSA